ncbi:T9SS type A sorting domain-containing protein [Ferruginibacter lapsinanis]|uniref:T9SS type A sorting domain-containing protein n=1 Tax=Ferruginibacter lapsinanis TaxID=563172 RepID=UPI001E3DCE02|nr:T9SS type A sorting domain-containing protein [Ferruginibacter lapsinanis]UEG49990.1 T9SS type A sorting domain-containing protein [Ferruginibacter lapsinanis]
MYKIDVTTRAATLIGSTNESFIDIAFDPLTNILYGTVGATLYTIDINNGTATQVGSSFTGSIFGLFFTDGAELYGFHTANINSNSATTTYYKINKIDGTRVSAGSGPQATRADACSCPFRLSHTLKTKAACMRPGQDTVFTVSLTNITTSFQSATFDLTMDKRFSFTETASQIQANVQSLFPGSSAVATISSVNGGTNNVISINSIKVPVTTSTPPSFNLAIKAKVSGFNAGEQILFQSVIDVPGNTLNLGADLSDDPLTAQLDDATTITICTPNNGPLPVSISDFKGQLNQSNAILNWTTQHELNTNKFEIERSFDGVDFDKLAELPAKASGGTATNYQYTDAYVYGGTIVYYRLKAIDNDGIFKYSSVVTLKMNGALSQTIVYPTSFSDFLSVYANIVKRGKITIYLSDAVGKKVAGKTALLETGSNTVTLNGLDKLQKGFYFVKIYNENEFVEIRKVIKQ